MLTLHRPGVSAELAALRRLLHRLEIPDCEHEHPGDCCHKPLPCPCGSCRAWRKEAADRKQQQKKPKKRPPCDMPVSLPPPCDYILDRDHDVDLERWASLAAKYQPSYWEGQDGVPVMHDDDGNALPALRPTAARPGSEAKIQVMRDRLARGEHIHSDLDADTAEFLGLGETLGFSPNGEHPRAGIYRLRPGLGIRQRPGEERRAS